MIPKWHWLNVNGLLEFDNFLRKTTREFKEDRIGFGCEDVSKLSFLEFCNENLAHVEAHGKTKDTGESDR